LAHYKEVSVNTKNSYCNHTRLFSSLVYSSDSYNDFNEEIPAIIAMAGDQPKS